jgi:predicted ATPase/class 3 adenylate cyclase
MLGRVGAKALPDGTVTLLFTDVEGSTKLLHALGTKGYAEALAEHRRILRAAFEGHGGVEVDTQGDAFFFAFADAPSGLAAAGEARSALHGGPISVRMGIHTGTPLRTEEGYVGVDIHRAARIAAAGHGGQVLVSVETAVLADGNEGGLVDLGEHRLKDLAAPEHIYQLGEGGFPPLKALSASNLPVPTTPFIGREAELDGLSAKLADPAVRVLTILGPGGIGKTRLALQAAAEASDTFLDGLWWVALAPLGDALQAPVALAQTLGVREEEGVDVEDALAARLEGRRTLVLLDNAEHLLPELARWVARLLRASDRLTVLVTSRERLQLSSEHIFTVPALTAEDAAALLQERAAALGLSLEHSETVDALCERLDRLPLALQLAAARLRTFSTDQLLERLSARLDLLKGGRDLEPRQQTLRATLEWSHDLLTPDEQALFRRLAVFVGGCTLEAAEAVCDANVDVLEGLADKSLLQRRVDVPEPRFWMLESIRDFAGERLAESGERDDFCARHARYFRSVAERAAASLRAGEPEEIAVSALERDIDNLRAAVGFGLDMGDEALVREITASLPLYWMDRGLYTEGRSWLERALSLHREDDDTTRRLLSALGTIAYAQGDHDVAVSASDQAAGLAMRLAGVAERFQLLREQARAAGMRGDVETAERLSHEALDAATAADNGVGISACRLNLVDLANETRRHERSEALALENLPFVRERGQTRCEAYTLAALGETWVYLERRQEAADHALAGARRASQIHNESLTAFCLDIFAAATAQGDARRAATILGATEAARDAMGTVPDQHEREIRARTLELFRLDSGDLVAARAAGRALDLASALELAAVDDAEWKRWAVPT